MVVRGAWTSSLLLEPDALPRELQFHLPKV
jgi:hypothetical protein